MQQPGKSEFALVNTGILIEPELGNTGSCMIPKIKQHGQHLAMDNSSELKIREPSSNSS